VYVGAAISMGSSLLWERGRGQLTHSKVMVTLTDSGGKSQIKEYDRKTVFLYDSISSFSMDVCICASVCVCSKE